MIRALLGYVLHGNGMNVYPTHQMEIPSCSNSSYEVASCRISLLLYITIEVATSVGRWYSSHSGSMVTYCDGQDLTVLVDCNHVSLCGNVLKSGK